MRADWYIETVPRWAEMQEAKRQRLELEDLERAIVRKFFYLWRLEGLEEKRRERAKELAPVDSGRRVIVNKAARYCNGSNASWAMNNSRRYRAGGL